MVVKLSRNFKSADTDVRCYHMILTVVNPLFCANMVCMSDSALVFRLPLNQPSMLLSVYLNATEAFYSFY